MMLPICSIGARAGDRRWDISAAFGLAIACLIPAAANAYTAAGYRNFPATLLLPQPAPADAFWGLFNTQRMTAAQAGDTTRMTQFTGTYSKLITERIGIQLEDGVTRNDRLGKSSLNGAQNLHLVLQYEPILDQPHEFVLSVQVDEEFGATGDESVGSPSQSATTPGSPSPKDWATFRWAICVRSRLPASLDTRPPRAHETTRLRPGFRSNIRSPISYRR